MNRQRSSGAGVATLAAMALLAAATGHAGAQTGKTQVQLAFGYECDNRFVVRNDGASPADVEYGVANAPRTALHLNPHESVAIESATGDAMELWVNNRRVSSEPKGNRACATNRNDDVVVRPLGTGSDLGGSYNADYVIEPRETRVVYVNAPVCYTCYSYDPYYYGFGVGYGYGYYGYLSPRISVVVPFRSMRVVSRPGFGGGFTHVPVGRPGGGHVTGRTAVRR